MSILNHLKKNSQPILVKSDYNRSILQSTVDSEPMNCFDFCMEFEMNKTDKTDCIYC